MSDDSALHEKPLEFLTSIANTGGSCDGQAILPENGHFRCTCSCDNWDIEVDDPQEGLRLARIHTGSPQTVLDNMTVNCRRKDVTE